MSNSENNDTFCVRLESNIFLCIPKRNGFEKKWTTIGDFMCSQSMLFLHGKLEVGRDAAMMIPHPV